MKKTIVSTNRLMILAMMMVMTISASKKDTREFSEMGVPFLFICKTHDSITLS